jgi:hypothetical protein
MAINKLRIKGANTGSKGDNTDDSVNNFVEDDYVSDYLD